MVSPAVSQQLSGHIVGRTEGATETLPGASVWWAGTTLAVSADAEGNFTIAYPDSMPARLVTSYIGYLPDTIYFPDKSKTDIRITLARTRNLKEVTVTGKQDATIISTFAPINTQVITREELTRGACCNLSESFETNASVDVNYTDAVSGARQIQMLGLDGIYTQILSENLPLIRGLSSSYGLNFVPGPWVESIMVTKGAGSVVNGYESITGQLDIELLEPSKADRFFLNGYANHEGRFEGNLHLVKRFGENHGTMLFGHASDMGIAIDHNHDGFLDMPLTRQYNALNRWHFQKEGTWEAQLGLKTMVEDRTAGQSHLTHQNGLSDTALYSIGISNKQLEAFTKTALLYPEAPYKSIALTSSERYHEQEMFFGAKRYRGEQLSVNINGIYQTIIVHTRHRIKFGPSYTYDDYRESYSDSAFSRRDHVPGAYTEYTFIKPDSTISLVAGARGDYHNRFGVMFTPRMHFKYNFKQGTALRISGGSGWRIANIFVENAAVFPNSRKVVILEELRPEQAWNYGISFTHKWAWRDAFFNVDMFRTDFTNQVVVDLEDADLVQFYNLKGRSYSNSFQAEAGISPTEHLDLRVAYKHYDVMTTYGGTLMEKPMVPKDRAMVSAAYETNDEKWKFDVTLKWLGSTRLPNTLQNPIEYRLAGSSEDYFNLNAQVTKKFKHFELYLGGENLTGYYISNPIIAPDKPFGNHFDASMIWGPTVGSLYYFGFRFSIE